MSVYAELQVTTNFSFLRGASHPEEMVAAAAALGCAAIAITDRNSLAGVVRAHSAAKTAGIRLIVAARLDLDDAPSLLCYPTDRAAYGRLSRLISLGRRRSPKGQCRLTLADVIAHGEGQILAVVPPPAPKEAFISTLNILREHFKNRFYLSVSKIHDGEDERRLECLSGLAARHRIPLLATNDVHAHEAGRRPLQDVLTCIREGCTLTDAGCRLFANGERFLKPPAEMARLFRDCPDAVARTGEVADRCRFSLDQLRYEYPIDPVPAGRTPQEELTRLAWQGAAGRYPQGVPEKVRAQVAHELALIAELGFAPYFLTVHDIVRFARSRGILAQGRGSAANSAVCYCLGITAVDPTRVDLLFERFVSAARNEPPDIDVDFEHERREEVIQYIFDKYGRERAGMTAAVIRYRSKSAIRDVAKVFGLTDDAVLALQAAFWRRSWEEVSAGDIRAGGLDPDDLAVRAVIALSGQLIGFPRHLSQHTGGMVMTRSPLAEVVPIENAAMAGRTVIEWDKDDLDALGILKIDILALGMLTAVRKAFALIDTHHRQRWTLATIPAEDPAVYEMLCEADSVGVFQVESRAQMSMLPRLQPRCFYDLVIEVAIVRPGPIQGDMVHPYLRRRAGLEAVVFPSDALAEVLGKTLGVPLFQEQAMRIAIVAAGFSPTEADGLRRAMATFRRSGTIHAYRDKFIAGMIARGYHRGFAERCFQQIEGFADYGFPESHAASFALIVYVSAWLKRHYPAAFACALLNSQPMGFYAPAQLVGDARRHGVPVLPVDINASTWDCTLEPFPSSFPHPLPANGRGVADLASSANRKRKGRTESEGVALRLGFRQVKGLAKRDAEAIVDARGRGYRNLAEIAHRTGIGRGALETLAKADAFGSLGLDRRHAWWAIRGLDLAPPLPLFDGTDPRPEPVVALAPAGLGEDVADDFRALRLSLKAHPLALLRQQLRRDRYRPAAEISHLPHGMKAGTAGLVITRQRPGSANGVMFLTLEDETGHANLIVWPDIFERFRTPVLRATLLGVVGTVQREGAVVHLLAERLKALDNMLGTLKPHVATGRAADEARFDVQSRDFH